MFIFGSFLACHPQRCLKETFDSLSFIYILDDEKPKFYFYVLAINVEPSELLFK